MHENLAHATCSPQGNCSVKQSSQIPLSPPPRPSHVLKRAVFHGPENRSTHIMLYNNFQVRPNIKFCSCSFVHPTQRQGTDHVGVTQHIAKHRSKLQIFLYHGSTACGGNGQSRANGWDRYNLVFPACATMESSTRRGIRYRMLSSSSKDRAQGREDEVLDNENENDGGLRGKIGRVFTRQR